MCCLCVCHAGDAQAQARRRLETLRGASIRQVFQDGLHEFVTEFIDSNNGLSGAISTQFLR